MRRIRCLVVAGVVALSGCASPGPPGHTRSGCYAYSVATDRVLYGAGQPVHIVVEALNTTSHDCVGPRCGGITPWIEIVDGAGRTVYRTNPVGIQCARDPAPPPVVRPGHRTRWDSYTWPDEPGVTLSPGAYAARWHWLDDVSVRGPVFIVARE